MSAQERQPYAVSALVAAMALLLMVYVAAYYANVRQSPIARVHWNTASHVADYAIGGRYASAAFWPIHRIDRIARRSYWEEPLPDLPTPWRHDDDVQYFSPGPEFRLQREDDASAVTYQRKTCVSSSSFISPRTTVRCPQGVDR